jgi:hypothetical protein
MVSTDDGFTFNAMRANTPRLTESGESIGTNFFIIPALSILAIRAETVGVVREVLLAICLKDALPSSIRASSILASVLSGFKKRLERTVPKRLYACKG